MDRFLNTKLKETETGEHKALQVEISLSKVLSSIGIHVFCGMSTQWDNSLDTSLRFWKLKKNNIPILSEIELKGKYKTQEVARAKIRIRINFWFQVLTSEKIYLGTIINYLHDTNEPMCPDPQVSNSKGHYVRYVKSVTLAVWK